jgi:phosphate transport system protein
VTSDGTSLVVVAGNAIARSVVQLAHCLALVIETRDLEAADAIDPQDETVDRLHRGVFTALPPAEDKYPMQTAIDVTLLSRYYERFADHAVCVSHRMAFLTAGEPWDDRV